MNNAPIISPDPDELAVHLTEREVEEVRARRASLRRAVTDVRETLGSTSGAALAAVRDLGRVWAAHTAATEAPDGMLAQVLTDSTRLSPAVGRLRREHEAVTAVLLAAERLLAQAGPDAPIDPVTALPTLNRLLDAVYRHRRDGRKLIYDAYNVDLGLGE